MIYGRTPFEAVACGCKRIILSDIEIFHEPYDGNATFLSLGNEEAARKELKKSVYVMVNDDFSIPFDVMEKRIGQLFN